jgi:hypothetical protein
MLAPPLVDVLHQRFADLCRFLWPGAAQPDEGGIGIAVITAWPWSSIS